MILEMAIRGARCWWVAPTYRMAGQVWRDLKRDCRVFPEFRANSHDMRIDGVVNGGSITIRSAHTPDRLRGAGVEFMVVDEAAYIAGETWNEVLRPTLLEKRGGAMFLSTPWGRNWFYALFQMGQPPRVPGWRSWQFPSSANPLLLPEDLDMIRQTTPDAVFRSEYLAEFLDDAASVFRGAREAATAPVDAQPGPDRLIVGGIDWGRSRDFTVVTLIDVHRREVVAVDRFNQIGWEAQRGRIASLCARWQPAYLWAESNSMGEANIEALQAENLPVRRFAMTAASKGPLIDALALAIERRDLALLPDLAENGSVVLRELSQFAAQRLPGGGFRYGAPPGAHDDCVISLALAWHGVVNGGSAGLDWA